jgi:hypothetical protein
MLTAAEDEATGADEPAPGTVKLTPAEAQSLVATSRVSVMLC